MKALKKALIAVLGAVLGCWFFVGCLSTKLSVTYMVDGETYRVQEYELDTKVTLPTPPTKEGYTFIGWYTDPGLTIPYAEGNVTAGFTLYAKFSVSSVYIVVNTAGGNKIDPIEVAPGTDYTVPEAEKEGYTFLGYTYIDENGEEQLFPLSGKYPSSVGIKITAKYEVNKYTVTFVGADSSEQEVEYGSKVNAPAAEKPGYTFDGWYTSETEQTDETKFDLETEITEDLTLYAKYTAKTFTIKVNGAQSGYVNPTVKYGEPYTLVVPDRGENYTFVKFTKDSEDFPATGIYTWTENIAVDTVWDGKGRDISFYDGANELDELRIETEYGANISDFSLPSVPEKDGYTTDGKWYVDAACTTEFVLEGTVDTNINLYAKYTANTYKVTIEKWENGVKVSERVVEVKYGEYLTGVPATQDPTEFYTFDGYYYGDTKFDVTAKYETEGDIKLVEKWNLRDDLSLFEYNQAGNYFTEREDYTSNWTYVFVVTSTPYTFAEGVVLNYVNNADAQYATLSGNTLTATAVGTFTVQITQGSSVITRTFKTVEYIQSMSIAGTTYDTAWGLNENGDLKRNYTGVWDATFTAGAEAMKVGKTNFIPELNYNGKVSAANGNFTATVTVDGVETTDYTINNGSINFGDSLVGKRAVVTIKPKYSVNVNHQAVYEVEINNAVNVYSHEDLKAAFANTAVKEVNILRDITPTLSTSETMEYVDEYGTPQRGPINYERLINPNTGEYYKTKYSTGVYVRRTGGIAINGNYFTVDGRNLPLVDPRTAEEDDIHKPGSGYGILDNRFSIFLFGRRNWEDRSSHRIDNLNIIGNANLNAEASYDYDGVKILKYSGSVINVHVAGGKLNMTNVSSRLASMALYGYTPINFADACGVVINAKDCIFDKSWANNFYVQGFVDATFDSCYFGQANGASIHVDTLPSTFAMDAAMRLINGTDIQNWVTGQEAWFVGQNLTSAIPMVQVGVDSAVQQVSGGTKNADTGIYSGGARTILKDGKMNFAMLVRRKDGEADWIGGKDATGKEWMAYTDAYYQGYLQSDYIGQGALNVTMDSLFDLGYAGFMAEAAKQGVYTAAHVQAYCMESMTKKFVMAPNDSAMGYMEFYLELADNK